MSTEPPRGMIPPPDPPESALKVPGPFAAARRTDLVDPLINGVRRLIAAVVPERVPPPRLSWLTWRPPPLALTLATPAPEIVKGHEFVCSDIQYGQFGHRIGRQAAG